MVEKILVKNSLLQDGKLVIPEKLELSDEDEKIIKEEVNQEYKAVYDVLENNPIHINEICKKMNFTSLRYYRIEDLYKAIGIKECDLCTYCFNGKE